MFNYLKSIVFSKLNNFVQNDKIKLSKYIKLLNNTSTNSYSFFLSGKLISVPNPITNGVY